MSNFNVAYIFTAIDRFSPALSRMSKQVDETRDRVSGFRDSLKNMGGAIKDVGESLTKGVSLPLMAAGTAALYEAEKFDNLERSLKYVTGSAAAAKAMFGSLLELEARTPFDITPLTNATKMLSAYGMSAGRIQPTIMKLGDIAVGAGVGIDELARAYGRVAMRGRLSSREMMMFTQMQIPLIKTIADQLKLPQAAVAQMAQKGMISAAMVDRALVSMTAAGGRYHGAMADKMNSMGTATAKLKDSLEEMAAALGRIIRAALPIVPTLQSLTHHIETMTRRMEQLATAHPVLAKMAVWAAVFAVALMPLIAAMGHLIILIGAGAMVWAKFTAVWAIGKSLMITWGAAAAGAVLPFIAVAAALASVGNALRLIWKYKDTLKSVFSFEGAKDLLKYVTGTQAQYTGPQQKGMAAAYGPGAMAQPGLAAAAGPGVAAQQGSSRSLFAGHLQITVPRSVQTKMSTMTSGPADFDTGLNMAAVY